MNRSESLTSKLVAAFSSQVGLFIGDVLITILVARTLGPAGKGLFSLTATVAATVTILTHLSLSTGATHLAGRFPHLRPALAGNSLALAIGWGGIVTAIFALCLTGSWPQHLAALDARLWGMALAAVIPLLLLEYGNGLVLGMDQIKLFSYTNLARETLLLLALAGLAFAGVMSAYTTAAVWVTSALVAGIFLFISTIRRLDSPPFVSIPTLKSTLRLSLQTHTANLFGSLKLRADPIMLGLFMQATDVGYYSIATAMVMSLWYLPAAVAQVLLPLVSGRGDIEGNRLTPLITRVSFGAVAVLAVIMALTSKWVIVLLIGEKFLPAVQPLLILLPGTTIFSLAKILSSDLMGRGLPKYGMMISMIAFLVNILAGILLIPKFGMAGAAAATSVTHAFSGLMFLHYFLVESGASASEVLIPRREDFDLLLRRSRGR